MLEKYYGISNIKNFPIERLENLLKTAYERELYERWMTIYPYMEMGHVEFVSFEEYKNKAFGSSNNNSSKTKQMSNDEIEKEMMGVVRYYEQKQKAGGKINGNI